MKFEWNRKDTTIAAYSFIVLALSILFFHLLNNFVHVNNWLLHLIKPVLPIFYGFALAYLLNPIMVTIEIAIKKIPISAKLKQKHLRTLSLMLTYLFALAILTTFALIVLPQVYSSISTMAAQIQDYVASAEQFANNVLESIPPGMVPQTYINQVSDMVGKGVSDIISMIGSSVPRLLGFAFSLGSGIIGAVMGIIVSCYLLASKEKFIAQLRKIFFALLPRKNVEHLTALSHTTDNMFGRFITGKIIDSLIIGVLCFVGLSVIKMPNTVLVSFIVGVTNVIPYFGPFLGAIPSFFLIAFISPPQALIFLVFVLVLQQLDGNVIGPLILGDSTGLSAFWVIFAILFFGGAFGIFGMFIGVPTFGVIYWLIRVKITELLKAKNLPTDTESYMVSSSEIKPAKKAEK